MRLPIQLQRAMAAEAEAARESRAKVMSRMSIMIMTVMSLKDVRNETSLFPSSLRHVMLQYFGIFQPSSGIMMTLNSVYCLNFRK